MPIVQTMSPGGLAAPAPRKKPEPWEAVALPGQMPLPHPVQPQPVATPDLPLIYSSQAPRLGGGVGTTTQAGELRSFYGLPVEPASAEAGPVPAPPWGQTGIPMAGAAASAMAGAFPAAERGQYFEPAGALQGLAIIPQQAEAVRPPLDAGTALPQPPSPPGWEGPPQSLPDQAGGAGPTVKNPVEDEAGLQEQRADYENEMKRLEADPVTARFARQLRELDAEGNVMRGNIRATLPEGEREEMEQRLESELLFERLRVGQAMNRAVTAEAQSLQTAAGIAHRKGQRAYEERLAEDEMPAAGPLNPAWWEQKLLDDFGPYEYRRQRVQQQVQREADAEEWRRAAVRKTGLDPDNPEHGRLLEDAKKMDWTTGGQPVGESAASGEGMAAVEAFGRNMIQSLTQGKWDVSRVENSRVLSDGSVMVNPLLIQDNEAYARAVQEAAATPAAKQRALAVLKDLQRGQAKALLPSLKSTPDLFPGEQYTDYVARRAQEEAGFAVLPEAEQARLYLREQMQRGYGTRLADKLGTSLLLGVGDLFTQVNGVLGMATGWIPGVGEFYSQGAADLGMLGAMVDESTEARTGTGALGRVTGGAVRMLPPVIAQALLTRGLRVNLLPEKAAKTVIFGLAGAQTAGAQYASLYGQLRQQGAGPMEAWMRASGPAMASGLVTAGLTALGGATGTEALLLPGARERVAQGVRGFWRQTLKNVPAHAVKEVPEEFFDEMASTVMEALALGNDPKEALGGFLAQSPEFIGSVMLLGGSGGVPQSRQQAVVSAPMPLVPAQGGDRPVPVPPMAGEGGTTGSAAVIQGPEASVPPSPPQPARPQAPAPSGPPMAAADEVGVPAPQTSPGPIPPGQQPQAASIYPVMARATAPAIHRMAAPAPPIWQGPARHGEDAAVLGRNPDGTFQVWLNGAEKTFKESQVAAMTGMQRGPLYEMLAQATRQQLALPHPPSLPPIWQGRATHGEAAAVLGRNPDGTFQVRLNGVTRTFSEPQVAAMTGLKKGPLYEMLGRVTGEGLNAKGTRIDNELASRFNLRRGDRSNIVIAGGLPPGQAGEFDRSVLFDEPIGNLFGTLQATAKILSAAEGRQQRNSSRTGTDQRNESAPAATFEADGTIGITGNPRLWADALLQDNKGNIGVALEHADLMTKEEIWHVAQLVGMRNDWVKAGKPGSFVNWVHDRSAEIMESIGDAAAKATPAEAARIKTALFATWELYFAEEGHGQTPESVFRQLTSPVQRGRLVTRGTFLAEFTRQLHQAGVTGQTTETAGLLGRLRTWVQQALEGLKQVYAMARGGVIGQPLKELIERTEAVLQGRETALPIQPGLRSGPGDAFLARWTPKPVPPGVTAAEVENWRRFLYSKRVQNPVYTVEVVTWTDHQVPADKTLSGDRAIKQATQAMLDLIPREVMEAVSGVSGGSIKFATVPALSGGKMALFDPNTNTIRFSHSEYDLWRTFDEHRPAGMVAYLPELLRESVWHEITHWLYVHADAHPRLKMWRDNLEQHWNERTAGIQVEEDPDGSFYLNPGWIDRYAGLWYPGFGWGYELPTVYMEQMSRGPERVAELCQNSMQIATFKIVASLFGPL